MQVEFQGPYECPHLPEDQGYWYELRDREEFPWVDSPKWRSTIIPDSSLNPAWRLSNPGCRHCG